MTQHNNDWGDIPQGWEVKTYAQVFNYLSNSSYSRSDLSNNGLYGYIHYGDIHTKWEYYLDCEQVILPKLNSDKTPSEILKEGDLVMADASEDIEGIGKSIEILNIGGQKVIAGLHTILLRDKNDFFVNGFRGYIHQMPIVKNQLRKYANGLKVYGISKSNLSNIYILIPTKPEQTAIATVLSDTDKLIDSLSALIAKKQAIKSATMSQLLSGQKRLTQFANHLDGTPKTYIQTDNGKIPEDWEVVKLGDLATFLKGNGLPKKDIQEFGKYPAVHYGELFINYKEKIDKVISFTDIDCPIKSVKNDVLMPTSDVTPNGLATASCIQLDNVILGGDILVIRIPFEKMNGVFLAYFIRFNKENILKKVKGTTVFHLYAKDMAELKISIPKSTTEQTAIAQILVDMDSDIVALEHRLTKTKALKQGLMHQLLTGKIRLI